jgi:hypothetical protein
MSATKWDIGTLINWRNIFYLEKKLLIKKTNGNLKLQFKITTFKYITHLLFKDGLLNIIVHHFVMVYHNIHG